MLGSLISLQGRYFYILNNIHRGLSCIYVNTKLRLKWIWSMMGNLVWYCPWWRYLHNTLYQPALYNMAIRWKNTIRDGGSTALYPVYIALWKKGWQFKKSGNVQLWKLISLPIFIQFMNVFCGGSLDTPKMGKWKNKVTNINLRACKTWRGVCYGQNVS